VIVDSSAVLAIFFHERDAEDLLSTILEAEFATDVWVCPF
jgi:PIN domain nuclease of toxin-antitoxin system